MHIQDFALLILIWTRNVNNEYKIQINEAQNHLYLARYGLNKTRQSIKWYQSTNSNISKSPSHLESFWMFYPNIEISNKKTIANIRKRQYVWFDRLVAIQVESWPTYTTQISKQKE